MKKIKFYFLSISILFTILAQAQIKKGSIFLGGDIGGVTQKTESGSNTSKQSGFFISPVFGKAIKENLVLGTDLLYGHNKYESGGEQTISTYGIGVFLRKYKAIGSSGFYIFLQGRAGYRFTNNKLEGPATYVNVAKNHTASLSIYPGLSYAVSKRLHLETGFNSLVSVNYFTETAETGNPVTSSTKTSGLNISSSLNNISNLYLGFRVLLSK